MQNSLPAHNIDTVFAYVHMIFFLPQRDKDYFIWFYLLIYFNRLVNLGTQSTAQDISSPTATASRCTQPEHVYIQAIHLSKT